MTRLKGWAHNEVDRFGILTALPQAVADAQIDFWNDIWKGTVISQKPDQDTVIKDVQDDLDWGQRPQRMATASEYDIEHLIAMDGEMPGLIRSPPRGALP
eukprot:1793880-Pyramimonas_sp.AAC.1